MSIYVMSDIHGQYNDFLNMLSLINFNDLDHLIIAGDVLDVGPKPLEIIDYIRSHDNITLIKGNHEELFEDYFITADSSNWLQCDGASTLDEINHRGKEYEYLLYSYILGLPKIKVLGKFIIVHAGLFLPKFHDKLSIEELLEYQYDSYNLWTNESVYTDEQYKDYTIICGHKTVQSITGNSKILHKKGRIFIDCGCGFTHSNGKLACLRLDDMEEFYI